jgi:hypothetical protein
MLRTWVHRYMQRDQSGQRLTPIAASVAVPMSLRVSLPCPSRQEEPLARFDLDSLTWLSLHSIPCIESAHLTGNFGECLLMGRSQIRRVEVSARSGTFAVLVAS